MRISDWSSDVCSSDLPGGPCDDDAGFAAGWRPPTIRGCERGYGMWAGWLGRTGQLDPLTHPWDRVTRERVKAFITEYSVGRAELTVAGAVRGIAYVLRARSEEHTSELQSLMRISYAVFCLKKKYTHNHTL